MTQEITGGKKATVLTLLFLAQYFAYATRYSFSIVGPTWMKLFHINAKDMGFLLGAWNWSYTLALLLVVSPLVNRVGVYALMGAGMLLWGLSTASLALAGSGTIMVVVLLLFGLGDSPLIPTGAAAISEWFDLKERARAVGVSFAGAQIGLATGGTIAAFILARWGWHAVFYSIGGTGFLMALAWFALYPDKSIGKPVVRKAASAKGDDAPPIPWYSLFRFRSTWGISLGQLGYLYAYYFFVSWFPGYLILERHMTLFKTGIIASLPFWAGFVGVLAGGWVGDYMIRKGVPVTVTRKSISGGGLILSTVAVVSAAFVSQAWLAVTLMVLTMGFLKFTTASNNSLPIDLTYRSNVFSLTSVQNFFGNAGGLLAPIITGYIVQSTGSFVGALIFAGGMATLGAIGFVFVMGDLKTSRIEPNVPAAATALRPEFLPQR